MPKHIRKSPILTDRGLLLALALVLGLVAGIVVALDRFIDFLVMRPIP